MIGVILWTDITDGKAVIWCEDQGDLAFVDSLDDAVDAQATLDIGDVVRFDVEIDRNARLARNVTRLLDNWGSTLRSALGGLPTEKDQTSQSGGADIVPFGSWGQTPRKEEENIPARKLG